MIYDKLYSWQKNIIDKFHTRDAYGLFLDMGLGKTPISLAMAEANNCKKIIVITINAKANESETLSGSWLNWARQMKLSYTFLNKFSPPDKCITEDNQLIILNYESLFSRSKNRQSSLEFKEILKEFVRSCKSNNVAIIVDESHKMKNLQSQQTKAILKLKRELLINKNRVYSYLLSGTPFTQGYIDLYAQLKMLGYDESKTTFTDRFCVRGNLPGLLGWQQPIVGYKNLDSLYILIHKYALTIKSEEILDLPDMIFVNHTYEQSEQFYLYTNERVPGRQILQENARRTEKLPDTSIYQTKSKVNNPYYRNFDYPSFEMLAETTGTFWLRARQIAIGFQGNASHAEWYDRTRLNMLETFLENNPDNYVMFYNFTPELVELYEICDRLGYNVDVYCGEIKQLAFYERYEQQTEEERVSNKKNIILSNFASGSTGMNWQLYSKCIIFSLPAYKDYAQGIKRVHRLGQTRTVFYHMFYQQCWLDFGMKKALDEKVEYTQEMFNADSERVKKLTLEV